MHDGQGFSDMPVLLDRLVFEADRSLAVCVDMERVGEAVVVKVVADRSYDSTHLVEVVKLCHSAEAILDD